MAQFLILVTFNSLSPMVKQSANSNGFLDRKLNTREIKERFLIICGGTETEPNYFRSFRVPRVVISIQGLRVSPSQVVEHAIDKQSKDDFDQVWCVRSR